MCFLLLIYLFALSEVILTGMEIYLLPTYTLFYGLMGMLINLFFSLWRFVLQFNKLDKHDLPLRKPCCDACTNGSKFLSTWELMIFSKTLHKIHVRLYNRTIIFCITFESFLMYCGLSNIWKHFSFIALFKQFCDYINKLTIFSQSFSKFWVNIIWAL